MVKHKFLRWNEVSRRYVDSDPVLYWPDNWRGKADNVKQGSSDTYVKPAGIYDCYQGEESCSFEEWRTPVLDAMEDSVGLYHHLLKEGVCAEQARMVLPQSMMTSWVWSGSLDAFADMVRLRLDPHTQYESRLVAQQINDYMQPLFPVSWKALLNNDEET